MKYKGWDIPGCRTCRESITSILSLPLVRSYTYKQDLMLQVFQTSSTVQYKLAFVYRCLDRQLQKHTWKAKIRISKQCYKLLITNWHQYYWRPLSDIKIAAILSRVSHLQDVCWAFNWHPLKNVNLKDWQFAFTKWMNEWPRKWYLDGMTSWEFTGLLLVLLLIWQVSFYLLF